MNHIDERLTGWLDGSLDQAARDEVRAHCAACGDCRRLLEQSESVWSLLGELPAPEPARPAWEGIAFALGDSRAPGPATGAGRALAWRRWSFPAVAAAALVCGVVLGDQLAVEPTGVARILSDDIVAGTLLSADADADLDGLLTTAWTDPAQEGSR